MQAYFKGSRLFQARCRNLAELPPTPGEFNDTNLDVEVGVDRLQAEGLEIFGAVRVDTWGVSYLLCETSEQAEEVARETNDFLEDAREMRDRN